MEWMTLHYIVVLQVRQHALNPTAIHICIYCERAKRTKLRRWPIELVTLIGCWRWFLILISTVVSLFSKITRK
jgi:hypothetical protein